MQALDHAHYLDLVQGAEVLEADGTGDKVLRLRDGSMLKLFRRKRLVSSAAWYPYAQRFADNCVTLAQRTIPCPRVLTVCRIAEIERDAVHYDPLAGYTLRQLLGSALSDDSLRTQLGRFIADLHEKGIYFRSAHLGNVILTPEGNLGLIDIADMKTYRRPLRKSLRLRNFKHMLRYQEDRQWLLDNGNPAFLEGYMSAQSLCDSTELTQAMN
ncbi:toluene tolerance protein [Pseudomonas syringae]|uniref:Toluene tolerance protein n=3 Tax=Pseudomonas syringae TaxID=317 RepID=A0A656JR53_PSESF|nr:toluene tolerance protein [Pseudomonas syringae]EPN47450.1 toluene tolerance protein [Pseudomonas syringae pv. actinidiae ICMP 19096]EPM49330.1 toluene tolerance protein [Pseudomonas syringae pv. actinidiae ICMP 19098]EPN19906.1 toluene tolerance protein [Pseudomonas syringae pv. actinidiae ICMP 19100]EPN27755.1 toluene tolerance protein [Pseudomonas syringae pv. actinidiae ICMP 19099]EPN35724.1 toluene tolerance protein [Pseudomonas syringae pv. actinidiae ICMP 18883]